MSGKNEETITALAITLADGSHRLSVPGWPEMEYVQGLGFPLGVFARATDRVEDVVAETIREARIAAMMALPDEDGSRGVVWTPEQVVEGISAINPPIGVVMDYRSIRAHLTALLMKSEPTENWTDAKVASVMVPAELYKYAKSLKTLYDAAFPKPSAGGSGEE